MPRKSETPAVEAGASRNSCGGTFHDHLSPASLQAQFLATAHQIRPEMVAMLAALVFGGGHHA